MREVRRVVAQYPLLRSKSYPNSVWWWGNVGERYSSVRGPTQDLDAAKNAARILGRVFSHSQREARNMNRDFVGTYI
jgi:hypothetical protein